MLVGFTCYLLAFSPAVRRAHTHFGSLLAGAQPGTAGAGSPRVQSVSLGCVPCPDFSPCGTLQPPACCSSAVGLSSPGPPPQTSPLTNPHEPSCKSKSTPQLSTELAGLSGTEQNFPAGSWYHPPLSSLIFQLMTHGKP